MKFSGTVVMKSRSTDFNELKSTDAEVAMEIWASANNGSGTHVVMPAGKTTVR